MCAKPVAFAVSLAQRMHFSDTARRVHWAQAAGVIGGRTFRVRITWRSLAHAFIYTLTRRERLLSQSAALHYATRESPLRHA
jgi:hypothetical protein